MLWASSPRRSWSGLRVALVTSAHTAQMTNPQKAIIATHMSVTSQNAQWLPYQNIITTTSINPETPGVPSAPSLCAHTYPG